MRCGGAIMTVKDNYMLNFNKFLSCLTKEYYDPRFAVNTILNYVQKFTKDPNPYMENMKQCMTFDNLFKEFCKNNLSVYDRYEDDLFLFVKKYGKLQKILKKIPEKRHRNIYNLRQWVCQCKYICKRLDIIYNIHLEMALIIYYMKRNGKMSIEEAYSTLLNEGIFEDNINKDEVSYINNIINKKNKRYELEYNIFISSIILPPASCELIFHGVNCFINKRSLENTNYITYIHKISKYGIPKNQNNPVYRAVFENELRVEQNIIAKERHKILNLSKNKFGYWLSDRQVYNILLSRYANSTIVHGELQAKIYNRLMKARKLGLVSNSGYTPLMEFLIILDCMIDMKKENYNKIFEVFVNSDLAKYGLDIKEDVVKDYLKKIKNHKINDDTMEVVYYSRFDTPPIDLDKYIAHARLNMDDGKASLYSKERFLREIEEEARLYVKEKHPVLKSQLYIKAYDKELSRAMYNIWKPIIFDKGVMERVSREVTRFDNQRKNK